MNSALANYQSLTKAVQMDRQTFHRYYRQDGSLMHPFSIASLTYSLDNETTACLQFIQTGTVVCPSLDGGDLDQHCLQDT
jgi:hypothetical protein